MIYLMIGLPGSGKSTYIKNNKREGDLVISSDQIREELFPGPYDSSKNGLVFNEFHKRFQKYLKSEKKVDCYLDATFITKKARIKIFNIAKNEIITPVVFYIDINILIERDLKRERTVGEDVIHRMLGQYQKLNNEEYNYFSKSIEIINYEYSSQKLEAIQDYIEGEIKIDKTFNLDKYFRKILSCEQNSFYHQESLEEHLKMINRLIDEENLFDSEIYKLLCIFHDLGKPLTRKTKRENLKMRGFIEIKKEGDIYIFENEKGAKKEVSRPDDFQFIGHERTSANLFLFNYGWLAKELGFEKIMLYNLILNHLNYHNEDFSLILYITDKIGHKFSEYDSKGRISLTK